MWYCMLILWTLLKSYHASIIVPFLHFSENSRLSADNVVGGRKCHRGGTPAQRVLKTRNTENGFFLKFQKRLFLPVFLYFTL